MSGNRLAKLPVKPQVLVILLLSSGLILSYQNCADNVAFTDDPESVAEDLTGNTPNSIDELIKDPLQPMVDANNPGAAPADSNQAVSTPNPQQTEEPQPSSPSPTLATDQTQTPGSATSSPSEPASAPAETSAPSASDSSQVSDDSSQDDQLEPVAENEDIEDADLDHEGKLVYFRCRSGSGLSIDKLAQFEHGLPGAEDLAISNKTGDVKLNQVRSLSVDSLHGSLRVSKALTLTKLVHLEGETGRVRAFHADTIDDIKTASLSVRAADLTRLANVKGATAAAAAASKIGEVENIESEHFCLSANEIAKVSGIKSERLKIKGRRDGKQTARANEIAGLQGFVSIAHMDIASLHDAAAGSRIVIRGGEIGEISDIDGELTLINVKVTGKVKNVKTLRVVHSTIKTEENIGTRIENGKDSQASQQASSSQPSASGSGSGSGAGSNSGSNGNASNNNGKKPN